MGDPSAWWFGEGLTTPHRKNPAYYWSPTCISEVKNAWGYTSTPQNVFTAWGYVEAQGELYVYLNILYLQKDGVFSTLLSFDVRNLLGSTGDTGVYPKVSGLRR
jgi:hypothetical protein